MTDFTANANNDIHQNKHKFRDVTYFISVSIGIVEIISWINFGSNLPYKVLFGLLAVLVALVRLNEFRVLAIAREVGDEQLMRSSSFKLLVTFVVTCVSLGMVVMQAMVGYSEAAKNADPQVRAAQAAVKVAVQKLHTVQSTHTYTEAQLAEAQVRMDAINARIAQLLSEFSDKNVAEIQAHLKKVRDFWSKSYKPGSNLKVKNIMTDKCVPKNPYGNGPMTTAAGEYCKEFQALEAQSPAAVAITSSPELQQLVRDKEGFGKMLAVKSQIDAAQLLVTQAEQRLYALQETLKTKEIYPPFFEKISIFLSQGDMNLSPLALAVVILTLIIYVIVSSPADFESAAVHLQMRLAGREFTPVPPREGLVERAVKWVFERYKKRKAAVQPDVHTDVDEKNPVRTVLVQKVVPVTPVPVIDTDVSLAEDTPVHTDVPKTAKAVHPQPVQVPGVKTKTDPKELERIYQEIVSQIGSGQLRIRTLSYSYFRKSYTLTNKEIDVIRVRLVKAGLAEWQNGTLGKECYQKRPMATTSGNGAAVNNSAVPMAASAPQS